LLGRIRVVVADDLTATYPAAWPVRLTLTMSSGTVERAASQYPRGNAENPVSTAELEKKFTTLVGSRFGTQTAAAMLNALHSIEQSPDMATLFASMGRLKPAPTHDYLAPTL
jgi:2-methylcitrate dehydratase PrpD